MNEKDKPALNAIEPIPELGIAELDDRLDMAMDGIGLLALNQFFANNCASTNTAPRCGIPGDGDSR